LVILRARVRRQSARRRRARVSRTTSPRRNGNRHRRRGARERASRAPIDARTSCTRLRVFVVESGVFARLRSSTMTRARVSLCAPDHRARRARAAAAAARSHARATR
jgi:hypothetical protein